MALRCFVWFLWIAAGLLIVLAFWPQLDLTVSGWFYRPAGDGFYLRDKPFFNALHLASTRGAWVFGCCLLGALLYASFRNQTLFGIDRKGWIFLLGGLLLGPCLLTNTILKDNWGRHRPHEVTQFGGQTNFSPYYMPQPVSRRNGSFVAGDPSFGFYLPFLFYVVRDKRRSRIVFSTGMAAGMLLGFVRIATGNHFLSDVLGAALLMLAVTGALHALMYGPRATRDCWRQRLGLHH